MCKVECKPVITNLTELKAQTIKFTGKEYCYIVRMDVGCAYNNTFVCALRRILPNIINKYSYVGTHVL